MPKTQEAIACRYETIAFQFQTTDIGDANGTMATIQATSNEYIIPYNWCVLAIAVYENAALSTGTLVFAPTKNGTAFAAPLVTLSSSTQYSTTTCEADKYVGAANTRLGVKWTKSGTVSATTTDANATVYVQVEIPYL